MSKIRIKLKAYDHFLLDKSVVEIVRNTKGTGAKIIGPIPLPTKRKLYTVLRSPHVDKKSREQFEMKIYKRIIDIENVTPKTTDAIKNLNIPAGVYIEIKTLMG
ncbi:MAG: 30S ribosomal protein S10 [Candidatus Cloacimonetes bacterium]|nr:30S ribosomal protein S10 [Candidatus Cloacimonadota bacterium]MBL7085601.1 30S ribosomal protein S10 [Candidatus Cloacimonadota bacterium]